MRWLLFVPWFWVPGATALGQQGEPAAEQADAVAKRNAEYMNRLVRTYVAYALGEDGTKSTLRLHETNLLSWSNPVSGVRPGGLYLWTRDDRPAALLKMFHHPRFGWFQQFQSLVTDGLSFEQPDGKAIWRPGRRDSDMRRVPEAPAPGRSPQQRLLEMRLILKRFAIYDQFQLNSEWVLRLLPKPLYRYSSPQSKILDGAVFAFVQGTNPEVLVLLEARGVNEGQEESAWYFVVARETCYPARATYQDRPVWSVPLRYTRHTKPDDEFYARLLGPTPTVPGPAP